MSIVQVSRLEKTYPAFKLEDVSFSLEEGRITGFIGRNGAGKTTTLKSMLGFVHPDRGDIRFFGKSFAENQKEIKQQVGYVSGGVSFYPTKKLKTITAVTRGFYREWDDAAYRDCLRRFSLDESKTPAQLSEGMKVKYALALALSHRARLLILDEPTSGLDPVSRDELLDVFLGLQERGTTILFSTHITSDLDKCADDIIYIQKGRILASSDMKSFESSYKYAVMDEEQRRRADARLLIGCKRGKQGYTAIVKARDAAAVPGKVTDAGLETIMVHLEKEEL